MSVCNYCNGDGLFCEQCPECGEVHYPARPLHAPTPDHDLHNELSFMATVSDELGSNPDALRDCYEAVLLLAQLQRKATE